MLRSGRTLGPSTGPSRPPRVSGGTCILEETADEVARNLYILAGVLLLFAALSFVMAMTSGRMQAALPANGTLWKTTALFLTVGGLLVALLGVMTAMFEQVDRRTEERRWRHRGGRGPGTSGR